MRFSAKIFVAFCGLLVVVGLVCAGLHWRERATDMLLEESQTAFDRGRFDVALQLAERYLAARPDSSEACILAGQSAVQLGRLEVALECFASVETTHDPRTVEAQVAAGELAFELGRARQAERHLRTALQAQPDHGLANGLLAYLLVVEGRTWEAEPFLIAPIRQSAYPLEHLLLLGANEPLVEDTQLLERFRQTVPDDPVPLIGLARQAAQEDDLPRAERLLRRIVEASPEQVEAQARLGEVLLNSPDAWLAWHRQLPAAADVHAHVWVVRGQWAEMCKHPRVAARCYWQAVRRGPNHLAANQRLGRSLSMLGYTDAAMSFLERAAQLERLDRTVDDLRRNRHASGQGESLELMANAAQLCESLGRTWEAWGWARQARKIDEHSPWASAMMDRVEPALAASASPTLATDNPAQLVDLSDFPEFTARLDQRPAASQPAAVAASSVSFRDDAPSLNLHFRYYNDANPEDDEVRLIETTGGGVAVLDYDNDGWPDLYFTQGAPWPAGAAGVKPTGGNAPPERLCDRLYRSLAGREVRDVTDLARLGDMRYSQGVAVGDFDSDGFADLYVANIGKNQLYHNNGDGTFSEVGSPPGATRHHWTTSCVMADLNGDALADLYDVNYVSNDDLAATVCRRGDEVGGCSPGVFKAAQDRLLVNLGDGRFQDVSEGIGVLARDGMGLGVVAADFTQDGRLDLFVANDAFPNSFFVAVPGDFGDGVRFEQRGVASGLAYDEQGRAQACMGVAVDDVNRDGLLDVFVTNFRNEPNSVYLQQPGGMFLDATRSSGMRQHSFPMLGFGTQFLDAELDGLPDLVVANGHIFDMRDRGIPYHMPAQFFRNVGDARFEHVPAGQLGEYFRQQRLGRGLARLDWNRDGREDFVVSHVDAPAALLTNTTPNAGRFLAVRLAGTQAQRDAIGAVVTVTTDRGRQIRQLTSGDGYQAGNQRQLVFGLGNAAHADIDVTWPGGRQQEFHDAPLDAELQLIEGRATPVIRIRARPATPEQ